MRRTSKASQGTSNDFTELTAISEVPPAETPKVLGAYVHPQGSLRLELEHTLANAWRVFTEREYAKLRIHYLGVFPTMAWKSGTRHWTSAEWWPRANEEWPDLSRRCSE